MGVVANAVSHRQTQQPGRCGEGVGTEALDRQHQHIKRRLRSVLPFHARHQRQNDKKASNRQPRQGAAQHAVQPEGSNVSDAEFRQ